MSALRFVSTPDGLVAQDDLGRSIVGFNTQPDTRPYLHPIIAPAMPGSTVVLTEDEPPHHPWQHGLYIGLNDVNGLDYWCEGKTDIPPDKTGRHRTEPPIILAEGPERLAAELRSQYLSPAGDAILRESQTWEIAISNGHLVLDLSWRLQALVPIRFGRYEYGGLFLRMPFRGENGGEVANSEGHEGPTCEGKRARWVRVRMPLGPDSGWRGFLVLDHPHNPEHPVPWRVDFELGVGPSRCIVGPWHLGEGEACVQRYRLITCDRSLDNADSEKLWKAYSRTI